MVPAEGSGAGGGGDVGFEEAFEASDAEQRRGSIPDEMPLDYVRERCEKVEKVLRLQFKPDPLPPHFQRKLSSCPADGSPEDLVERWVTLSHLLRCVRDDLRGWGSASDADVEEAARKLMRREPVEVELESRTVRVTGRSYAAMLEMARHELRLDTLRERMTRAAEVREELAERAEAAESRAERKRLARRRRKVVRVYRLMLQESRLHRRALYAHAFTEDGAPAESLEDAPDWWEEVGPAEHVLLLSALFRAGPGRLSELGRSPDRGDSGRDLAEDWGYKSLIASFEQEAGAEPASYFDRDLGQLIAWMRSTALEPIDG